MDIADEESQRRLLEMLRVLTEWRPMLQSPVPVGKGSSLYDDDQVYPEHPASQVAWAGIASAIDHLDLLLSSWRATGNTHPYAHRSVARQVLVGGAQAIWVLEGSWKDRIGRALRVAWDDLRSYEGMVNAGEGLAGSTAETVKKSRERIAERKDKLKNAAAMVGLSNTKLRDRPTAEEMVEKAAHHIQLVKPGVEPVKAFRLVLRQQNGFTHAMQWSSLTAVKSYRMTDTGQIGEVRTSIEDLVFAASAGMLVVQRAIEMFRSRASG